MKLSFFSAVAHLGDRLMVRRAGGVLVAEEFHIAAKRNGRELPARAVAVVEADKFGAETDREHQDPDAAPARDQEMAELVEEHDDRQNEQERDDIADDRRRTRPSSP